MENDNEFISVLLESWGLGNFLHLFIEQEFTRESFSNLQYECLADLFPKAGPRNQFWAKYKNQFLPNQDVSRCTTMSVTTFEDYDSLVSSITPEPNNIVPINNIICILDNNIDNYLKCANGVIIGNYYAKHKILDNKNRNSLATLIVNAEFNNFSDKQKFVIRSGRFKDLATQIGTRFPNEPECLYFIAYNPNTRSIAKGKLWETYNYLKKKLRIINNDPQHSANSKNTPLHIESQMEFLQTHFEPIEDLISAWKETFDVRQNMLENPTSSTSIDQYFTKFSFMKGQSGSNFILLDFELKYKGFENKIFDNWEKITAKIIQIADSKNSPDIQLAKQQKSNDILMLCLLPYLLPHAYLKKTPTSKRLKLTKHEILENIFIHVKDGNLLTESVNIHMEKLKKYNLTFQPTVIFVGDTLEKIIGSYVMVNSILYQTESPLAAVDLCFKAFQVLNANYPEGSQVIWLFIQKAVYELITRFDPDFISLNSLLTEITN